MRNVIEEMENKVLQKTKNNKIYLEENQEKIDRYISNKNHLLQK